MSTINLIWPINPTINFILCTTNWELRHPGSISVRRKKRGIGTWNGSFSSQIVRLRYLGRQLIWAYTYVHSIGSSNALKWCWLRHFAPAFFNWIVSNWTVDSRSFAPSVVRQAVMSERWEWPSVRPPASQCLFVWPSKCLQKDKQDGLGQKGGKVGFQGRNTW